jgi:hypothetical protein
MTRNTYVELTQVNMQQGTCMALTCCGAAAVVRKPRFEHTAGAAAAVVDVLLVLMLPGSLPLLQR